MRDLERRLSELIEANAEHVAELQTEHARIVSAVELANADDEHDPEGATIAFEREQVAALLAHARATGTELAAALQRLVDGTFGRCEGCGTPIADARLEARPDARTCIDCAS